jgi:hypothetical protein
MRRLFVASASLALTLTIAFVVDSCASVPAKRVDTVLRGAVAKDLGARLVEVSVAAGPSEADIERVVRELFPVAAARVGLAPAEGEGEGEGWVEYAIWLREKEYTIGMDTYSAVLCALKLRSKNDGSVLATTIVADETKLNLKSSGYLYALLRDALASLVASVAASEKAARAAAR